MLDRLDIKDEIEYVDCIILEETNQSSNIHKVLQYRAGSVDIKKDDS